MPTQPGSPGTDNVKLVLEETEAHKAPFQTPPHGTIPASLGAGHTPGTALQLRHPKTRGSWGCPIPSLSPGCPGGGQTPLIPMHYSAPLPSVAAGTKDIQVVMGLGTPPEMGAVSFPFLCTCCHV